MRSPPVAAVPHRMANVAVGRRRSRRRAECGPDFPAWLGRGKAELGRISKMGQRDLRRLPVAGAIAVIRWAFRRGTDDPWLAALLTRKLPMLLAAAVLANRMARTVRAVATTKEIYRAPASARETGDGRGRRNECGNEKGVLPGFDFRLTQGGGRRRRRRGKDRGQCKGEQPSRRDRENRRAFEAPPSAQKRYGSGPRISMQAGGNHQVLCEVLGVHTRKPCLPCLQA